MPIIDADQNVLAIVPIPSALRQDGSVLTLSGRSLLDWTLSALERVPCVSGIVIAPERRLSHQVQAMVSRWAHEHSVQVVAAATDRITAIRGALALGPGPRRVLIHDADRPLLSAGQLASLLAAASDAQAAVPAVHVKSTFKVVEEKKVKSTVPRDRLLRLQSPWIFDRVVLETALERALEQSWQCTGEACLVRHAGIPVQLLPGDYFNIPLSDRLDVEFVEMAMARRLLPALQV